LQSVIDKNKSEMIKRFHLTNFLWAFINSIILNK
jgi:hypothetical protein